MNFLRTAVNALLGLVSAHDPEPFFHVRHLGDARPPASHVRLCTQPRCRRHFTPARAEQALCQRCVGTRALLACRFPQAAVTESGTASVAAAAGSVSSSPRLVKGGAK